LDLPAQRRLRHQQALRGPAEVKFFRYRHKAAQLIEGERHAWKVSKYAQLILDKHGRGSLGF
jgi:hypothetical protein